VVKCIINKSLSLLLLVVVAVTLNRYSSLDYVHERTAVRMSV